MFYSAALQMQRSLCVCYRICCGAGGFIKPEQQTDENIYAIMNYVLSGDSYGNKIAEGIAKNIIKIYGVPVQPAVPRGTEPTEPIPSAAPTNQTTPIATGADQGGKSVKILD